MKNLVKLVAAGGVVFGLWFALLVLFPTPGTPIAEADADILSFDFAKQGDQEKFVEVLERQGLEKPRIYNWNGNTMFFSTTTTNLTPRQVLRSFQEELVRSGVNKKVHLSPVQRSMPDFLTSLQGLKSIENMTEKKISAADLKTLVKHKDNALKSREVMDDFFGGGLLPTTVSDNQVFMVGMTSEEEARTGEDFVKEMAQRLKDKKSGKGQEGSTLVNSVKSMRVVEAFKTNNGQTRITATWSDDNLDINKVAQKGEDLDVNPEFPACIGCDRLNSFRGQSPNEKNYASTIFDAKRQSIDQVMSFYTTTLINRGWLPQESSKAMLDAKTAGLMPHLNSEMMAFGRDGKFLTLLVLRTETGETQAHLMQSN